MGPFRIARKTDGTGNNSKKDREMVPVQTAGTEKTIYMPGGAGLVWFGLVWFGGLFV